MDLNLNWAAYDSMLPYEVDNTKFFFLINSPKIMYTQIYGLNKIKVFHLSSFFRALYLSNVYHEVRENNIFKKDFAKIKVNKKQSIRLPCI